MLNSCLLLETLIIEIDSCKSKILPDRDPPFRELWKTGTIVYECIKKSLNVVAIKGFKGNSNEVYLLKYVIVNGHVMEKLSFKESGCQWK